MSIAEANAKIDKALELRENFFRAVRREDVAGAQGFLQEMELSGQYLPMTIEIFRWHIALLAH